MTVRVVSEQDFVPRAKAACARAVGAVLPGRDVVVALVDDETIAGLHRRFLGRRGATDVLSFPPGEIVASAETAAREAAARGLRPLHELLLYVVHGALHLEGHGDRTPRQRARMRAAERRVLGRLGVGDVFGTRRDRALDGRGGVR
ncbi:MAG: rRNA maturation RNase YbeY [Planctomycetota bacterium]